MKARRMSRSQTLHSRRRLLVERLESRRLLAATVAIQSGNWHDSDIWSNGVPNEAIRAIVGEGMTVSLNGTQHAAKEVVVHGTLEVAEAASDPTLVGPGKLALYFNGNLAGRVKGSRIQGHGRCECQCRQRRFFLD